MAIDLIPNKTQFGKTDKQHPFKAMLNGVTEIALGESKLDAKLKAQTVLENSYIAAQAAMVFRVAADGTVFCARWTSHDQMEYHIVRGTQYPSCVMGKCETSLQRYMDKVVSDYNAVCIPQTQTA